MNENSIEKLKQEQRYKILIRNLRKRQEGKNNEKTDTEKVDSNKPK